MKTNKVLLVLTYYFPPIHEPESYLSAKLITRLSGEMPLEVIAMDDSRSHFYGRDQEMEEVFNKLSLGKYKVTRFSSLVGNTKLIRKASILLRKITSDYFITPPQFLFWGIRTQFYLTKRIRELRKQHRQVILLTRSTPVIAHIIGLLTRRIFGLKWIVYMSDPWVGSPYYDVRSRITRRLNEVLEKSVMKEADSIVVTNSVALESLCGRYGELVRAKCHSIPHSFMTELYALKEGEGTMPLRKKCINILHLGALYGIRTPFPLLEALGEVLRDGGAKIGVHFYFIGTVEEAIHRVMVGKYASLKDYFTVVPQMSYLSSLSMMRKADILLNIDAPLEKPSEFLPTKLVDYFGSNKPIWAITTSTGIVKDIMETHQHFCSDLNNPQSIKSVLIRILNGEIQSQRKPMHLREFDVANVAQSYIKIINAGTGGAA